MAVPQGAALATLLVVAFFATHAAQRAFADVPSYYSNGPHKVTFAEASAVGDKLHVCISKGFGQNVCQTVNSITGPPKPLYVAMPDASGTYPVLAFQHGWNLVNTFYSQLMEHLASYGYIIVAPQMYGLTFSTNASQEIQDAADVINWLPAGLPALLSSASPAAAPRPDLSQLAVGGHSRGGKVAFALALGFGDVSLPYSAVVGIDPVDASPSGQTQPPVVRASPASFALSFPTLLVGSGLGNQSIVPFLPFLACAPAGFGHREFFVDSGPPAYYFVASDFGHMGFLDDVTLGIQGISSYVACKGCGRRPERTFAGGLLVAFLESVFRGNGTYLQDALDHPENAPVAQETPQALLPQPPPSRQQQASF